MTLNQGYCYRSVLGPSAVGHSALSYLATFYTHSTIDQWQDRIAAGEVFLNDRVVNGLEALVLGNVLSWNRPGWHESNTPKDYDVIFKDEFLLGVNKPSGLPTLPGGGFFKNTLLSIVRVDYPTANPLHRLGRATSGLVLFALNKDVAGKLSQSWPKIQKQYRALSCFIAEQDSYDIRTSIGEQYHPRLGKVFAANANGMAARSVATVIQRRPSSTLFEVDLHSGRPHQIRIHLASIGHPLEGDPLYACGGLPLETQPGLPGDSGYFLHAKRLVFNHPVSGMRIELNAPIPKTLQIN